MSRKKALKLEDILKHPKVQKITNDINAELLERRQYSPPPCTALSQKYTLLIDANQYKFTVDKEAQKQLPDIIDNKVQKIEGVKTVDASFAKEYGKSAAMSVLSFPADPHPAGIMSSPACMMRLKKPTAIPGYMDF